MICIFSILDNTFIGTLLAGGVLALFGLFLYRHQKRIDARYEELKLIKEYASRLFTNIEIVSKSFEGQLNIYDGNHPEVKYFSDALNKKFGNQLRAEAHRQINELTSRIISTSDELISRLNISDPQYNSEVKVITDEMGKVILYLSTVMVLSNSTNEEIKVFREGFSNAVDVLKASLQAVINKNI